MSEQQPNILRNISAVAAAGAFLGGCALSGTSGEAEPTGAAGTTEAYSCRAHLYPPDDVIAVEVRTQNSPFKQIDAQRIRVQLPNAKPSSKVAHQNWAGFDIPKDYSQIFVQAVAASQRIACATIYRPSSFDTE